MEGDALGFDLGTEVFVMGSMPARVRKSRSLRQWPSFETRMTVGMRRPFSARFQRSERSLAAACRASRRVVGAAGLVNCTRMKKRPVSGSLYWAASVMLPPCTSSRPVMV